MRLIHQPGTALPSFAIELPNGEQKRVPRVPAARGFPVRGRPDEDLLTGLRWYLEESLEHPSASATSHAERVLEAVDQWGGRVGEAVFGGRDSGLAFEAISRLEIVSDDPGVLCWPWEAVRIPGGGYLGLELPVVRRVEPAGCCTDTPDQDRDPERPLEVLFVSTFPNSEYGRGSVFRILFDLLRQTQACVRVHKLRPPSAGRLHEHLEAHRGRYDVLHLDVHGDFSASETDARGGIQLEGRQGGESLVSAEALVRILDGICPPLVVLNACRSAMTGRTSVGPPSISHAFLAAGATDVVAMSHEVYEEGACRFLSAFYDGLRTGASLEYSAVAGRVEMARSARRTNALGRFELQDWLIPVHLSARTAPARSHALPDAPARTASSLNDFVGRSQQFRELEKAVLGDHPAIVLCGLAGVGKTTLARTFAEWLYETEGLDIAPSRVDFHTVSSFSELVGALCEQVLGPQFSRLERQTRFDELQSALLQDRRLLLWDNFETISSEDRASPWSGDDRRRLLTFLGSLQKTSSTVLITSRTDERWLGELRQVVNLRGLDEVASRDFCRNVLADLDLDPESDGLEKMIEQLAGHPLAMRASLASRARGDSISTLTDSPLAMLLLSIPEGSLGFLVPLCMFEIVLEADHLQEMLHRYEVNREHEHEDVPTHDLLMPFIALGLVSARSEEGYELHPILTTDIRSEMQSRTKEEEWDDRSRLFVEVIAEYANDVAPDLLDTASKVFSAYRANCRHALREARRLEMFQHQAVLLQALAVDAQRRRDFEESSACFEQLLPAAVRAAERSILASACHHLGMLAEERHSWQEAEACHREALAIKESLGDLRGQALSHHQLGIIAEQEKRFAEAEGYYREALQLKEKLGDKTLGTTLHQLGMVKEKQGQLQKARGWYGKALRAKDRLGETPELAATFHQLGMIEEKLENFTEAESWYRKAVRCSFRCGNRLGLAITYHQIASLKEDEAQYEDAESWALKALELHRALGHMHSAALNQSLLARALAIRGDFVASAHWILGALRGFQKTGDEERAGWMEEQYFLFFTQAPETEQEEMKALWQSEFGDWPFEGLDA